MNKTHEQIAKQAFHTAINPGEPKKILDLSNRVDLDNILTESEAERAMYQATELFHVPNISIMLETVRHWIFWKRELVTVKFGDDLDSPDCLFASGYNYKQVVREIILKYVYEKVS